MVIGHLPAGLEPGKLGQFRSQRLTETQRKPPAPVRLCHQRANDAARKGLRKCSRQGTAEYVLPVGDEFAAAERNGTANCGAACL